ncbi:hypothetical protein CEXT_335791 [Caerostris extrusa]|uniref:Uncharacterized protein n=1 Tax=Caerostris extrusa TaxID=172846 RepID=A0AAV4M2U4_CAEEX|nr:hypothetical protein CEXT_335791 [Caerostris extrusa]
MRLTDSNPPNADNNPDPDSGETTEKLLSLLSLSLCLVLMIQIFFIRKYFQNDLKPLHMQFHFPYINHTENESRKIKAFKKTLTYRKITFYLLFNLEHPPNDFTFVPIKMNLKEKNRKRHCPEVVAGALSPR